jgi:hypothetical protein
MRPPALTELCPDFCGEQRIALSLADVSVVPSAFRPILIAADYFECAPEGIELPLELLIQAPSQVNCERRIFDTTAPTSITFTPREGGAHGMVLREIGHNRWNGVLRIDVAGTKRALQRGRR